MLATMYSFTHDPTLLTGGSYGGAIDIYDWLLSSGLLDRQTGFECDTLETANDTCRLNGGVKLHSALIRNFLMESIYFSH